MSDWFYVLTLSVFIHTSATCALVGHHCVAVFDLHSHYHMFKHTRSALSFSSLTVCWRSIYRLNQSWWCWWWRAEQRKKRRSCCVHFALSEASDNERKRRESDQKSSAASLEEKVRDLLPLEKPIYLALRLN